MSNAEIIETLKFYPSPDNNTDTFIEVTQGIFTGVAWVFGRTWFPDENEPVLSFDYDIKKGEVTDENKEAFLSLMGDTLLKMLHDAMEHEKGDLVFTGGAKVQEGEVTEIIETPTLFEPPPKDSTILTPWSFKLPQPEPGTKMSRNLLEGL